MLAKVYSGAVVGLEGQLVEVEVDLLGGIPRFNVVGLPDTAVSESRERVKSAVRNSGFLFPTKVVTASLAPADVKTLLDYFDAQTAAAAQGSDSSEKPETTKTESDSTKTSQRPGRN